MTPTIAALALVALLPAAASADEAGNSLIGKRVRVRTAASEFQRSTVIGHVERVEEEALVISVGSRRTLIRVARDSILRVEVKKPRPRGRGFLRGAGIGIVALGLGGALMGYASGDDDCLSCFLAFSREDKAVLSGIGFGVIGGVVGGVAGIAAPGEQWSDVPGPARVRIGLVGAPRGRGAGLALSF